jgi:hypothetical protein
MKWAALNLTLNASQAYYRGELPVLDCSLLTGLDTIQAGKVMADKNTKDVVRVDLWVTHDKRGCKCDPKLMRNLKKPCSSINPRAIHNSVPELQVKAVAPA